MRVVLTGGGGWVVTLLLLCLQLFLGFWMTRVRLRFLASSPDTGWSVWANVTFYSFGLSAVFAGSWGLLCLVSSLTAGDYIFAITYSLLLNTLFLIAVNNIKRLRPYLQHDLVAPHPHPHDVVVEPGIIVGDFTNSQYEDRHL